jgi:hypothetical protein
MAGAIRKHYNIRCNYYAGIKKESTEIKNSRPECREFQFKLSDLSASFTMAVMIFVFSVIAIISAWATASVPFVMTRVILDHIILTVAAIPDNYLVMTTAEAGVTVAVITCPSVRVPIIDNYLIAAVQVYPVVTGRQHTGGDPAPAVLVYPLTGRYIIIHIIIRQVIVTDIIIPHRAPDWLAADIDIYIYLCLCLTHGYKYSQHNDYLFHCCYV